MVVRYGGLRYRFCRAQGTGRILVVNVVYYLWRLSDVYHFVHFLSPRCRVNVERPTGFQPVNKFLAFHGTRKFITTFTTARYLSLSWASSIHFIPPHSTSWRSILILSSHLRLGIPSGLPSPKPYINLSSHPYVLHAPPSSFFSILSPEQYWVRSTDN